MRHGSLGARLVRRGWGPVAGRALRRPPRFSSRVATAAVAYAVGAFAFGTIAVGSLAVAALAIRSLAIGRARIRVLEIDELHVRSARGLPLPPAG